MSQIASFTYLRESDIPFLGFWAKPKLRLFRKPVSKFDEMLRKHAIREFVFGAADGVYVAFVFAWFELKGCWSASEEDPVIHTVRRWIEGSHWLVECRHRQKILSISGSLPQSEWPLFLQKIGAKESDYDWRFFDAAAHFVHDRVSELQVGEALLVSVG